MKAVNLRAQGLINPLGINPNNIVLSYQLQSDVPETYQTAYRIIAASTPECLTVDAADLWDSGIVLSNRCFGISFGEKALSSRQRVYWKAMTWDQDSAPGGWSETAWFETGLNAGDWRGCWIGEGENDDQTQSPYLVGTFCTEDLRDIAYARAYISGLGLFSASLNGQALSQTWFDPGESDATRTVYYVTFDILPFMREGENTLGIQLGNGQYTGYTINPVMQRQDGTISPYRRYQKNDSCYVKPGICGCKKALAQVEIFRQDGSTEVLLVTNEHWLVHSSPITFQNWYGGEDYDATLEIANWDIPGTDRSEWIKAKRMKAPRGRLTGRDFPPIVTSEENEARSVKKLGEGHYLVDMGNNGAGVPVLRLSQTDASMRGMRIEMYPAEMLREDGAGVDQQSCTQSWSVRYQCSIRDSYRLRGSGEETWSPRFCYHGFQYMEVRGFPGEATVRNFAVKRLRAANEKQGRFLTSDKTLNGICEITERSIESNMFFSFTDCPQIEKLGWIETSHLMFRSLAAEYDVSAWMKKILRDIRDGQLGEDKDPDDRESEGFVPGIVPEFYRIKGLYRDLNWNGACIFTPWEYYNWYGDISVLEQAWPVMQRYMDYLHTIEEAGQIPAGYAQMGEWGGYGEHTPIALVENCAYYRMHRIMEKTAQLLDAPKEEKCYRNKALDIQEAFHRNPDCWNPTLQIYGTGSQASFGCALFSGIVPEANIGIMTDKLIRSIADNDYHLTSGEVGLRQVFSVLTEHGRGDVVWRMVMNPTPPSYRCFVELGMTTLPEYWNCDELWHDMVRSRNHAMMGHVRAWLSEAILGVRQLKPGWEEAEIRPYMPSGVRWAEGSIPTPFGKLYVHWERDREGKIHTQVKIPAGIRCREGGAMA